MMEIQYGVHTNNPRGKLVDRKKSIVSAGSFTVSGFVQDFLVMVDADGSSLSSVCVVFQI